VESFLFFYFVFGEIRDDFLLVFREFSCVFIHFQLVFEIE